MLHFRLPVPFGGMTPIFHRIAATPFSFATYIHHITQPQEFDRNVIRSLKPGAYLAIIDFPPNLNYAPVEGVPKNRGGHGIPRKVMVEELTSAGLQVDKTIDDWSGSDYCVIFKRPNRD
jgi:hypothetical protein